MNFRQSFLTIVAAGMVLSGNMNPFVKYIMDQMEECRENQNKKNRFFTMIERNQTLIVKKLLDECDQPLIYINARNSLGETPLHLAALLGHTETAKLLLDYKTAAAVNAKDNNGLTSLHLAAGRGHTKTVELLLDYKADVNARNNDSFTPLNWAALLGHTETAKLLLDRGADVNARDEDGSPPPLHNAALHGHTETVRLLLDYSANPTLKNEDGQRPSDRAEIEEIKVLLKAAEERWENEHGKQTPPSATITK